MGGGLADKIRDSISHNLNRVRWYIKEVNNWPNVLPKVISSKVSGKVSTAVFVTQSGTKILARFGKGSNDEHTVKEVFYSNCYKIGLNEKKLKNVVDVGSNIGVFALKVLDTYPEAKILAYEPDKENLAMLRANLALNNLAKPVSIKREPVTGDGRKVSFFHSNASTAGHTIFEDKFKLDGEKGRKMTLNSVSLASVIEQFGGETLDLLKIDCEGAEYEMFRLTPDDMLKSVRYIRLEYHDGIAPGHHRDIVKKLKSGGFTVAAKEEVKSKRWTRGMIFAENKRLN